MDFQLCRGSASHVVQGSGVYCKQTVEFFFCSFLQPPPRHTEIPGLGVKWELQLPAYTTATATRDPSYICDLHHSSWQHWILNPLSEARDRIPILLDTMLSSLTTEPQQELPQNILKSYICHFINALEMRSGAPVVAQWKRIQLGTMNLQAQSLALLSGLRIRCCQELWCRSLTWLLGFHVAVALA